MIVEGGKKYDVRLIPQTLSRENAIKEIVGALDHLDAISDEIFSTIRTRLINQKKQVEALSTRVSTASEQISNLKGTHKAIRIISPAKYPCEIPSTSSGSGNVLDKLTFPALVAKYIPPPPVMGQEDMNDETDKAGHRRPFRFEACIKHPNDLLSIFHVKEPKMGDLAELDNVADVGLGKPPSTIRNMDSFFLFNTIDNPYQNYKMTDRSLQDRNFGTLRPTRKGEEVQAEICPTTTPLENEHAEAKTEVDDFYYNPSALEIPDIDVPESLPDLPGIADSFDLADDLMSPTFSSKPFTLPSSSSIVPTTSSTQRSQSSSIFHEDDNVSDFTSPTTSKSLEEPSITRPSVSLPQTNQSQPKAQNVPANPPVAPPPPPPPPPVAQVEEPRAATAPPSSGGGGDLRSSLMAAIREAGGSGKASLRSAKDRKYEAKKKKQDEKEKNMSNDLQEGGDLMADLKNKLAMRRKGISGVPAESQKRAGGVGDIMMSLAATIPTFENSVDSSGGAAAGSDDDDWD